MTPNLTALELCCGIGGATLALHEAGFESVGVDVDYKAVGTALKNGFDAHEMDLFDKDATSQLLALQPTPDIIWASPSCRGFSQASKCINRAQKQSEQPNNTRRADYSDNQTTTLHHRECVTRAYQCNVFIRDCRFESVVPHDHGVS